MHVFSDCDFCVFECEGQLTWAKALGPASVMPTLTIKWDAAAKPMTRLLSAMGRTSAPVLAVQLALAYLYSKNLVYSP